MCCLWTCAEQLSLSKKKKENEKERKPQYWLLSNRDYISNGVSKKSLPKMCIFKIFRGHVNVINILAFPQNSFPY